MRATRRCPIPDHLYGDAPFPVNATASSGLGVTFASLTPNICTLDQNSNTVTLIGIGACSLAANQAGSDAYIAAPQVTQSFNVAGTQQAQSINGFAPPAQLVYQPGLSFDLNATATSGLAVVYALGAGNGAVCNLAGNTVNILTTGTCTITADQPGNGGFLPAGQLSADVLIVPPASQAITGFNPATPIPYSPGLTFSLTANGGAGSAPVVFGVTANSATVCSISGNVVTILTAGTCTVTADQAGDAAYAAAQQVSVDVVVSQQGQSIAFNTIPDHVLGDQAFSVTASASSGFTVTFGTSTGAVCSVTSGGTVTLLTTGTCTVTADQAGDVNTAPAAQVTQSFAVAAKQRKLYYVHADHLGTPRAITETTSNAKVWEWANSDPFGNNSANQDPGNIGTQFVYNNRFPGQYFDAETGTNYNWMRDYDPSIGRYTESDPIGLKGGTNTYGYVRGNPLTRRDPRGLVDFCDEYGTCNIGQPNSCMYDPSTCNEWRDPGSPTGRCTIRCILIGEVESKPGDVAVEKTVERAVEDAKKAVQAGCKFALKWGMRVKLGYEVWHCFHSCQECPEGNCPEPKPLTRFESDPPYIGNPNLGRGRRR